MDLVVTKWIAMEGTVRLAINKEQELREHFPAALLCHAKRMEQALPVKREYAIASEFGAAAIYPLGEGGILNGLWYLMEQEKSGMEVELRSIPIRQETVEICEVYDLNPYYMDSAGALLILTEHGQRLVHRLAQEEIPAAVIGETNKGKDRIIYNQGNKRYLDRPQREELDKVFG